MLRLPPDVGNGESGRDHGARREPAVQYQPPAAGQQGADDQRDGEQAHAVLVGQPQAENQAAGPPAQVTGPSDPGHHQGQGRPGQHVEGRRTEQVIATKHDGHSRGGDRGQQLRPAATAELPCDQPGQHDRRPGGQGRHIRSPSSDTPNSFSETQASSGVSTGWST